MTVQKLIAVNDSSALPGFPKRSDFDVEGPCTAILMRDMPNLSCGTYSRGNSPSNKVETPKIRTLCHFPITDDATPVGLVVAHALTPRVGTTLGLLVQSRWDVPRCKPYAMGTLRKA